MLKLALLLALWIAVSTVVALGIGRTIDKRKDRRP